MSDFCKVFYKDSIQEKYKNASNEEKAFLINLFGKDFCERESKTWENIKIKPDIFSNKQAVSLYKIIAVIDEFFGGTVPNEDWDSKHEIYQIDSELNIIKRYSLPRLKHSITFKTENLAYEFLSYPENVQLIKDFYNS